MSWPRRIGVWLLILPVMVANGILREVLLVPRLGERAAGIVSAAIGISVIFGITRPFVRRASDPSTPALLMVSLTWLVLTVAFEFLFGHWVDRKSWSELVGNYALWRGRLWPLVLASLVAAPFIWRPMRVSHARGS